MTPEEREDMYRLCKLIEKEQDPERFTALIKELNDLLERKEQRLEHRPQKDRQKLNKSTPEESTKGENHNSQAAEDRPKGKEVER
jgi:hypothetical protein